VLFFPLFNDPVYFSNLQRCQMRLSVSGISFRSVQAEPEIRLSIILWNSSPFHIEDAQLIPSLACATQIWNVPCCVSIPFGSELKALFNAFAVFIFLP